MQNAGAHMLRCQLAHGVPGLPSFWYMALIFQVFTLPLSRSLLHFSGSIPTSSKSHLDDPLPHAHLSLNLFKTTEQSRKILQRVEYTHRLDFPINISLQVLYQTLSHGFEDLTSVLKGEFSCGLWLCVLPGSLQNPFQQDLIPQTWPTEQWWTVKHFHCPWYCQMNPSKMYASFAMHSSTIYESTIFIQLKFGEFKLIAFLEPLLHSTLLDSYLCTHFIFI